MRARGWKIYVCLIVFSLFMFPGICAAQKGNSKTACELVRKTRNETFISRKKAWEPAGTDIVHQTMRYDGQVILVRVKFEKGAVETPHTHYHTQTTYVASGKSKLTIRDEEKIVKTGDGTYIELDILHSCVCLEPGVFIDCFAPMRADFLK